MINLGVENVKLEFSAHTGKDFIFVGLAGVILGHSDLNEI